MRFLPEEIQSIDWWLAISHFDNSPATTQATRAIAGAATTESSLDHFDGRKRGP